ncbi:transcriptional regulator Dnr [Marinobacter nanhaiticus D15-8W]|uniref:Crp/Fnr family transcriptional regulator n=1 Tax=Marinobacter nanhaiticus D15-8W TaxID=626887 RepID=N6WXP1_9GAMM|nr:Crp/Fnr family transcriptional regulator [Marinobacter nanhaiticus]ENO16366.1 Crp/Fnr family transcriptional regulator [Marinobacter nanhaiticus D15-8W]BES72773.1 transcriptional regulator Dnr [Marinobacter nanhaiticus D15-8W]
MALSTVTSSTAEIALRAEALAVNDADDALDALRGHPLFRQLSNGDFDDLVLRIRRIDLQHHQLLYRQDTDAQHFYFVVSGRLRLYRLDYSGFERTLDSLGAGDCFAEVMIYADPARYACYAESLKRSVVLSIPIQAYRALIKARPDYAETALAHYAARAVSRFHDLEIMTVQSARERLIRYLLDLLPDGAEQDGEIELPLPKCLIASRLAMQPETFSRQLNELKSNGLLRVSGSRLVIPDAQRLMQLSQ